MISYKALLILTVIFGICYCGRDEVLEECNDTIQSIGFKYDNGYLNYVFALSFLEKKDYDEYVSNTIENCTDEKKAYLDRLYKCFENTRGQGSELKTPNTFCEQNTNCITSIEIYELDLTKFDDKKYQYDKKNPYKNLITSYEIDIMTTTLGTINLNMDDNVKKYFEYHKEEISNHGPFLTGLATSELCDIIIPQDN